MKRKEKIITFCVCGRQLEGKFWVLLGHSCQQLIKLLAGCARNRIIIKKCYFCAGLLKPRKELEPTGPWGIWS